MILKLFATSVFLASAVLASASTDQSCPSVPLIQTPIAIYTEYLRQIFFDLNPSNTYTSVRLINARVVSDRLALYFEIGNAQGYKYFQGFLAKITSSTQELTIVKMIQSEDFGDLVRFFGDKQTLATNNVNCMYMKELFYISIFNNNFITPLFQQNVDILINKDLYELVQVSIASLERSKTQQQSIRASANDGSISRVQFANTNQTSSWPNFAPQQSAQVGGSSQEGRANLATATATNVVQGASNASGQQSAANNYKFKTIKNPHIKNNPFTMGQLEQQSINSKLREATLTPNQDIYQNTGGTGLNAGGSYRKPNSAFSAGAYMIGKSNKEEDISSGSSDTKKSATKSKVVGAVQVPSETDLKNLPKIVVKPAAADTTQSQDSTTVTSTVPKIRPTEWSVSNPEFYKKYSIEHKSPSRRLKPQKRVSKTGATRSKKTGSKSG